MRRTAILAAFAALALALVALVEPPPRHTGRELARGPHVLRIAPARVRHVDVVAGNRHVAADRAGGGWQLGAVPAPSGLGAALDALLEELAELRAVDAFRPGPLAAYGLDPPAATIAVTSARGTTRLALGSLNTAGSTLYARRDEDGRVLQIGVYLLDVLRRVLDESDVPGPTVRAARPEISTYWPEIG